MRYSLFVVLALAGGILASAGCGSRNGIYPVSGKVLYQGEPAVGAFVYFHRKGDGDRLREHIPQGIVGEDGSFTLASPAGQGALPGDYAVLIEWKEGAGTLRGRGPGLDARDRFHGRYMNVQKPQLMAEVKAERNRLEPFELR
jgi:hypothetical protein